MPNDSATHIMKVMSYNFVDKNLLTQALTAADHIDGGESTEGNRRLARLGESVIKLVVDDDWFSTSGNRSKDRHCLILF